MDRSDTSGDTLRDLAEAAMDDKRGEDEGEAEVRELYDVPSMAPAEPASPKAGERG